MDRSFLTTTDRSPPSTRGNGTAPWIEEDVEVVTKMYGEGHSMGSIGRAVGRTRGGVAGKISRLRAQKNKNITPKKSLPSKPKFRKRQELKSPNNTPYMKVAADAASAKPRRIRLKLIESDTAVTLLERQPHQCCWPLGDPKLSDFRYCGKRRITGKPYCESHTISAGRSSEGAAKTKTVLPHYRLKSR